MRQKKALFNQKKWRETILILTKKQINWLTFELYKTGSERKNCEIYNKISKWKDDYEYSDYYSTIDNSTSHNNTNSTSYNSTNSTSNSAIMATKISIDCICSIIVCSVFDHDRHHWLWSGQYADWYRDCDGICWSLGELILFDFMCFAMDFM